MYTESPQLRGRSPSKEKAIEIVNTAALLLKLRYNGGYYLMGKGFIGLFDNDQKKISPLFVVTIPNRRTWLDDEVKFYVSKLIRTKEFRPIQVIVETLIGDHKGDIIFSNDLSKLIGDRIRLPVFRTLADRREYVNNLIDFCLTAEKRKLVAL